MNGKRLLSPDDALAVVRRPDVGDHYSPLGLFPFLVCDMRGSKRSATVGAGEFAEGLRGLACPSIAVADRVSAQELDAFDVVLTSDAELDPLCERIASRPQASMAFVQLLRHSERLDVPSALFAESLVYSTLQSGREFAAWLDEYRTRSASATHTSHTSHTSADEAEPVLLDRQGDCLSITLNRPERRNALSTALRDAFAEALQLVVADDSIRRVRLSGAGPAFCSGGDLAEFGSLPDPATAHVVRSARNVGRLLDDCADRCEVFVHGACFGAGVELPAFAATVVADPDTTFTLPEVAMGLVPGAGGTASLPRRVGRQRTALFGLGGAVIDAAQALEWGLIDRIARPGDCG
jgi:enoyl-CoA hydratase